MINLTEKDADWIAKVAREQLQSLQKVQEEVMSEIAELEAKAEKNLQEHPDWERAREELKKIKAEFFKENNAYLKSENAKWQRVIELMMIGSEK